MWGDMGLSAFKKHTDVKISPVYYLCVIYKLALGLPGPDVGVPG